MAPEQQMEQARRKLKNDATPLLHNAIQRAINRQLEVLGLQGAKTYLSSQLQAIESDVVGRMSARIDKMSEDKVLATEPEKIANFYASQAADDISSARKAYATQQTNREHAIRSAMLAETVKIVASTAQTTGTDAHTVNTILMPEANNVAETIIKQIRSQGSAAIMDNFNGTKEEAVQKYWAGMSDIYKRSQRRPEATPDLNPG